VDGISRTIARIGAGALAVGLATLAVAALEGYGAVPTASSVYLVAVVAIAIVAGTFGAVLTAVASVVVYDFLFTDPRHTLIVADPGEWLNLVVLLFVAFTVGQLAALQRRRAETALAREREARALFHVSRALATRASTSAVLPAIAEALVREAELDRVWFALGRDEAQERVMADSGADPRPAHVARYAVLRRMPGDLPAEWILVHDPRAKREAGRAEAAQYRVRIEAGTVALGSIWALRSRDAGDPDRTATRLLAAAADQVGQALAQDRLAAEARQAEIARQSDALKSALIESVSHDLRTPLASIRAAAGTLMDPEVRLSWEDVRANATSIDRQAERLNRLVANLLDLGRIEGGALRANTEFLDLDDVVSRAVGAVPTRAGDPDIEVDLGRTAAVEADPVLLEEALLNVLDNAVRHTPAGTRIRIRASIREEDATVRLTVDDSGPGVATETLPHLFERFYRAPGGEFASGDQRGRGSGGGGGLGIGLAVVRGLVKAMGGTVAGRVSELGGLAIDIDLPLARVPAGLTTE
jgi:two-component system, OmpR family, sensor histidine kinase KdpD